MTKVIKRIVRCPDGKSYLFAWNMLCEAKLPKDRAKRRKLLTDRRKAQKIYNDHVESCDDCYTEFEVE